jgi:hypothetical protein
LHNRLSWLAGVSNGERAYDVHDGNYADGNYADGNYADGNYVYDFSGQSEFFVSSGFYRMPPYYTI